MTLAFLRKGYVTRYLNERLAIGLAPESLDAFFVQRARWARGALQILYLREGPLGPGLNLAQRLMFLPTHWLTQALTQVTTMVAPCIYLLTGLLPMMNVTVDHLVLYQLPMIFAIISALRFFAPAQYFPLATTVLGVLQSFRFLPSLIVTLFRPHGHAFQVTPKGKDATGPKYDRFTVAMAASLLIATAVGFVLNSDIDTRVIDDVTLVPVVALWCGFNSVVLMIVLVTAFSAPSQRNEERFALDEPVILRVAGASRVGRTCDLSLSGMAIQLDDTENLPNGDWIAVTIAGVGEIPARVVWVVGSKLGLVFHLPPSPTRDRMIVKIFTGGRDNTTHSDDALAITLQMVASIFRDQPAPAPTQPEAEPEAPPARLTDEISAREHDLAAWDMDTLAELWEAQAGSRESRAA